MKYTQNNKTIDQLHKNNLMPEVGAQHLGHGQWD